MDLVTLKAAAEIKAFVQQSVVGLLNI